MGFGERREFVMGRKRVKSGHGSESELKPKCKNGNEDNFDRSFDCT